MGEVSLTQLNVLLQSFQGMYRSRCQDRTFMQIAGYPHLENVASNILQFYFDPKQPHGLQGLFIETLFKLLTVKSVEATQRDARKETLSGGQLIEYEQVEVHREVATTEDKRIDLLIVTETFVIAIENKIYSTKGNPFEHYRDHLRKHYPNRIQYGVFLCLRQPADCVRKAVDSSTFEIISYQRFFQSILANLGSVVLHAREPYLTHLRDFISTLRQLIPGTTMDPKMLSYFQENRKQVEELLGGVQELRADMKQKTTELAQRIEGDNIAPLFIQGGWQPQIELYDLLSYTVNLQNNLGLRVNINLSPSDGWLVNIYDYHIKGRSELLESLLNTCGISWKPRQPPFRYGYGESIAYAADIDQICERLAELFIKLGSGIVALQNTK
ncbi:MAG: PD-(D/E)XK nuclease family protein [Ignavibacteria bacterium]|nr:PD-(D/E)XK nuclease family protein [Ignavibacteria bacterium]